METACRMALKEWAAVCRAIAGGRQSIILRKGGIHEGREGFRVEHREFWLFPTGFHQSAEQLSPEAAPLLQGPLADAPPAGIIRISEFAVVQEVHQLFAQAALERLAGLHIWSHETLVERFKYRQPGLFLLLVRAYRLQEPLELADEPRFAGCRSWVELSRQLPTAGLEAVLDDAKFLEIREKLHAQLSTS